MYHLMTMVTDLEEFVCYNTDKVRSTILMNMSLTILLQTIEL